MAQIPDRQLGTAVHSTVIGWCVLLLLGVIGCGSPASDGSPVPKASQSTGAVATSDRGKTDGEEHRASPDPAATALGSTSSIGRSEPVTSSPAVTTQRSDARQPSPPSSTAGKGHERTPVDEAQRQAWFSTARESPDVSMRLQALELWAQQPGEALDPVTYGLVDEDEQVRNRAQELYQQHLGWEPEKAVSVHGDQPVLPAE